MNLIKLIMSFLDQIMKQQGKLNKGTSTTVVPNPVPAFSLSGQIKGSAGVFKTDGTLVRTLFSSQQMQSGTIPIKWDGTDDFEQVLPVDNYVAKLLTNNVTYQRQGVIGNNSLAGGIHRSLTPATNIVVAGSNAYYATGYNENNASLFQFATGNPRFCINSFDYTHNQTTDYVCTDGVNNYWTAWDNYSGEEGQSPNGKMSFIFATKISDNTLVNFSGGVQYKVVLGNQYASVIDLKSVIARPSGIAVSSVYIFVAYANKGIITVLDKTTGAFVRDLSITSNAICGDGSNIWIYTTSLQKYPINTGGTLGASTLTISGVSSPVDIRVNGSMLAVVDGGTSQQIKTFDKGTGSSIWTFGQTGGSLTSPAVANDRFGFWCIDGGTGTKVSRGGIAFASDGSFWVCDPSNKRISHYDASRSFLESVIYQPATYTTYVDPNNHARFMCALTEFQLDYVSQINSSWILKYNWEGTFTSTYQYQDGIRDMTTFPNGKTYALVIGNGGYELIELNPTTGIRYTGKIFTDAGNFKMYANGDVYGITGTSPGETQSYIKYAFQNTYTGSNPNYANATIVLTINSSLNTISNPQLSGAHILPHEVTSSGLLITFKGNKNNGETGNDYHLGGFDVASNNWKFKTALGTREDYQGEYPFDGVFDAGNGSWYQANIAMAIERSIVTGYNGEAWKGSQVNKYNHFYDNGLFIGQFGATGPEYNAGLSQDFAGNAYSPCIIKEGSDYYLYHNDESVHGGPSRWKISNLSSIQEQSVNINTSFVRTSEIVPSSTITNLTQGLTPFAEVTNGNGWTKTPSSNTNDWIVVTGAKSYGIRKPQDIYIKSNNIAGNVSKDLGTNNLNAYSLSGTIYNEGVSTSSGLAKLEILDNTNKVIAQFIPLFTNFDSAGFMIKGNGTTIASETVGAQQSVFQRSLMAENPFAIIVSGAGVMFQFGSYNPRTVPIFDSTANWHTPKTLVMTFTGSNHIISIKPTFNSSPTLT